MDILDDISELVYITDINTYELLYMNKASKMTYQLEDITGKKCYEVLHGQSEPCSFCVNNKLKWDEIYSWQHFNQVLQRNFLLKDKLIEYQGVAAHLEIALDVDDIIREKAKLRHSSQAQQFLMECAKLMYQKEDFDHMAMSFIASVNTFLEADKTCVVRLMDETHYRYLDFQSNGEQQMVDAAIDDATHYHDWQNILEKHGLLVVSDIHSFVNKYPFSKKHLEKEHAHSFVIGSIHQNDMLYGFLSTMNPNKEKLELIMPVYQTLCYFLMISYKRWQDETLMKKLGVVDALTGLNNRNCYTKDTTRLCNSQASAGVIYLDLNGLKDINDRLGHIKGDEAVIECANLLRDICQTMPDMHIYRMGGDEFVVISIGISNKEFYETVIDLKKECEMYTSFKAAIGFVWSQDCTHLQDLVSEADFKMYEDKKSFYRTNLSGNRYRHYHDDVLELTEPSTLHEQISKEAFLIYLQPKFSFHDKSLIGAEALIRYRSPDGSILPPGQFLPLLEENNLISHIDFYVFEKMCQKQKEWKEKGKKIVPISTNFSRYSLLERNFIKKLNDVVDANGIDKRWMEIEITETVDGFDGFHLVERIEEIRKAGYAISIDDFGAHYANLSLFTSIEFNVLKIDKSLIDNIVSNTRAQSVISSIVDICRSMDVKIIVEGVETYLQFETLKRLGCEGIQGFLFSKPLPLSEYESLYINV